MNRADYLARFDRIAQAGSDASLHWVSGPRAGASDPWDGQAASLPGTPTHGYAPCRDVDGATVYPETLMGEPRLVIAGAGHVGQAFAAIATTLGFRIIVIDERREFADPERLPGVHEVLCGPYAETIAALPPYANSYFVLVTPGHRQDRESVSAALQHPFEYVGMIGSKGKVATVRRALVEAGFDEAILAQLHAPIGLPLGGREPAEIAVSIAAQVIAVRSDKGRRCFDPVVEASIKALAPTDQAVLATIVGHGGSVPRGAGSRMLVTPDGPAAGSVGGGAVEAAVIRRAQELLGEPGASDLIDYQLSNAEGAQLGMICGGHVRVAFEAL